MAHLPDVAQKPPIHEALAAVMADVRAVPKADRNQQQGFNFRGIDAVLYAVGPALRTHGVIVAPTAVTYTHGTVEVGKNRTPMGHMLVTVTYRFTGPAGDSFDVQVIGEAMDSGDKAAAKAMSVAYRTALIQALCLPTDEPDPDHDSYERSARAREELPVRAASQVAAKAKTAGDLAAVRALWSSAQAEGLLDVPTGDGEPLRDVLTVEAARLTPETGQDETNPEEGQ